MKLGLTLGQGSFQVFSDNFKDVISFRHSDGAFFIAYRKDRLYKKTFLFPDMFRLRMILRTLSAKSCNYNLFN